MLTLLSLRFLREMNGYEVLRAFDRWGDLLRAVDRAAPEDTIMSTLERTYQKGRVEGRVEGKAETILRQLGKRFGPLPAGTAERLHSGTEVDLERWADRILDARTLADVFAD